MDTSTPMQGLFEVQSIEYGMGLLCGDVGFFAAGTQMQAEVVDNTAKWDKKEMPKPMCVPIKWGSHLPGGSPHVS